MVIFPLPSLKEAVNKLVVCLELKNYAITFLFLKKIKQKKNRILNFHEEFLEKVVITLVYSNFDYLLFYEFLLLQVPQKLWKP